MIISFKDNKTEKKCNDEKFARRFFSPSVVERLKRLMLRLHAIDRIDPFFNTYLQREYRTERKLGDMKGKIGLHIGDKERVLLTLEAKNIEGQDHIKILEVDFHYGD